MCALRAQSAVELEPDMQHITLASHTSLALAHAACLRHANIILPFLQSDWSSQM